MIFLYIALAALIIFILVHLLMFIKFKKDYICVLMYHRVTNDVKTDDLRFIDHKGSKLDLDSMKVSPSNFDKQMNYLYKKKYKTSNFKTEVNKKNIYVTFDDGYKDNLGAVSILKKYNFTATIFVTVNLISNNKFMPVDINDQREENKLLTIKDLVSLNNSGIEIGCHTNTHPWLNKLNSDELVYEIIDAKNKLEGIINDKVYSFAYPGGLYNALVLNIVKENFNYAVATSRGPDLNLYNKNNILIERETISKTDSLLSFKLKVWGIHRFLRKLKWFNKVKGTIKWILRK